MSEPEIKPGRHYRTVKQARDDGWPRELDGVELRVDDYNHLGDMARAMLRSDLTLKHGDVIAYALDGFRFQCRVVKGRWEQKPWLDIGGRRVPNRRAPQPRIEHAV